MANLGAGLAYSDWPLFEGRLVPASHHWGQLHYAHRLLAAVVGVGLLALAWQARRYGRWALSLSVFALLLYGAQVMVGAANVWLRLATPARIAHLALAAAVWAVLLLLAAGAWGREGQREEAGHARRIGARP